MNKNPFIAAGIALTLALGVFAFYSFLEDHDDRIKMLATIEAQQQLNEQLQHQMQGLKAAEDNRDAQTRATIAAMQQVVSKVQTPQQIAQWLPTQLPAPQPIEIEVPPATSQDPMPPATAKIPQRDLPFLRDVVENCKECNVKLATAQADLQSRDERLHLAGEQLSATQKQRDAALKALKGGSFWTRLKRNTRWFLIGGLAGGALVYATHNQAPR